MNRRRFLAGVGTVGAVALAGCQTATPDGKFKLTDIGLVAQDNNVAAFVEVENITNSKKHFAGMLAPYGNDGVRLSDWKYEDTGTDSEVRPGRRVRLYASYEAGDNHWFDTNDVGQVVDAYTARFRFSDGNMEPVGPDYTEEDIGETLLNPNNDGNWI